MSTASTAPSTNSSRTPERATPRASGASAGRAGGSRWWPSGVRATNLAMIAPAAVFLLVFVGWPLVRFVADGFYSIQPIAGTRSFVGFGNYATVFSDPDFGNSAWRTAAYTALVVVCEFAFGFAVALLFNAVGRRSAVFRTIFLYPLMIAPVVAGLLWRFLLIDNFGIVNHLLVQAHLMGSASDVSWLSNPRIALFSVALPDIWLTTSFITLVLFAGLQNISGDILEAARLDGAGFGATLMRVVIPMLRPVIAVALIVRGIDAARAFDVIVLQTDGGPQNATQVMSLLVYQTQIAYQNPGLASAMGTLYLLVMLVVAGGAILLVWRPGADR